TTGEGGRWQAKLLAADGSHFEVLFDGARVGEVHWELTGQHNVANALATLAAARHVGVLPEQGAEALGRFLSVKRRMEKVAEVKGVTVYDDFAHHPTAIATTLDGLRKRVGSARIIAANSSFALYSALSSGACLAIDAHASEELKQTYLPAMYEGRWSGS